MYYENLKSLGNILILCVEISAAAAAAKILAIVFSRFLSHKKCIVPLIAEMDTQ